MTELSAAGTVWLDVTRLASRAGRAAQTGIDRVELAYLSELLRVGDPDTRFLCRTTRGYLLLDHRGAARLAGLVQGDEEPGRADFWSRATGRGARMRHRIEAALRNCAIDRCLAWQLPKMLARHGAGSISYLNVGHANLSARTLGAFAKMPNARIAVLIHDLIPITHPETASQGLPERFAGRIDRVRRFADLVICNSAATDRDLGNHWSSAKWAPATIVVHLGVEMPSVAQQERDPKAFVMVGTLEPRKNHGLMLDAWQELAETLPPEDMPHLHIIGAQGWRAEALVERLENHPLKGTSVFWHGPLPDAEMRQHLARAAALLFPSTVEGFGYPPLEAALVGTLPICSDLPVLHETLGQCAVYVTGRDAYSWAETIKQYVLGRLPLPDSAALRRPTWQDHFEKVGRALADHRAEGP